MLVHNTQFIIQYPRNEHKSLTLNFISQQLAQHTQKYKGAHFLYTLWGHSKVHYVVSKGNF
jgi:hypothetical protein